jgi:hypothetical protein
VALWIVPNIEAPGAGASGRTARGAVVLSNHYANGIGIRRIMEVLDRFDIRPTVALSSAVCRHHP